MHTNHKRIYLDYAAATPMDERVKEAMEPFWSEKYGNAGALHHEGLEAKKALEDARTTCARAVGAHADEVIFTSGGTESNNLAILGVLRTLLKRGTTPSDLHIVTTRIEHSSVLDCLEHLESDGVRVTYLPVGERGIVDPEDVAQALTERTVLVSIMYLNNEIGTIMPIPEIADTIRRYRKGKDSEKAFPLFHSDASQAPANLSCNVDMLGVDLMSIDAQKLYGPKGVGFLYKRRGVALAPILFGGNQEQGMRPGTPVIPLIVGMAKAWEIAEESRADDVKRLTELRDYGMKRIREEIPQADINGDLHDRVANNINISLPGLDGEYVVLALDAHGIAASTRSACLFGKEGGSPVVRALGKGVEYATSAIRLTLGRPTTKEDIDATVRVLKEIAG